MFVRACCVLIAIAAAGCGVRGAPIPPDPLFGQASGPPTVPQPYDRDDTVRETRAGYDVAITVDPEPESGFSDTLAGEDAAADGAE